MEGRGAKPLQRNLCNLEFGRAAPIRLSPPLTPRYVYSDAFFPPGQLPLTVQLAKHGRNEVTPHAHEFFELVYFLEGSGTHCYADRQVRLAPGDVFVVQPGEPHAYVDQEQVQLFNCLFLPEAIEPDLPYLRKIEGFSDLLLLPGRSNPKTVLRDKLHLNPAQAVRVETQLREIQNELKSNQPGGEAAARALLVQILVQLGRLLGETRKGAGGEGTDDLAEKRARVQDCVRYIEKHFAEPIRLEDLASRAYLSPEYFSRIFKRISGKRPVEFIAMMRIDRAKELLGSTGLSVTEVALRSGYQDPNYFTRHFRKITGQTPLAYRSQAELMRT